ncbi:uncharacterized protein [Panulirus ornatus]|uniref:uncharacterized protein n=1 Tax=Panulirus ornatus TaxID=150431 RepID=UPI003A84E20F
MNMEVKVSFFRLTLASLVMGVGVSVRMTALRGPRYVLEGSNVTLTCEFDLEGDDLYSLLWWHDGSVLLRYTSHLDNHQNWTNMESSTEVEDLLVLDPVTNVTTPALAWFPSQGVQAQLGSDGGPDELWLLQAGHEAAGVYTCEVTTEAPPTFLTANASLMLHVIVPPSGSPLMQGTAGEVKEGQWVSAQCESAPATPPPNLTFYINQKPVVDGFMSAVKVSKTSDHKHVVSRSVGFTAHRPLFKTGHLILECRVTIDQLVWRATSDLILQGYNLVNEAADVCSQVVSIWLMGYAGIVISSGWLAEL